MSDPTDRLDRADGSGHDLPTAPPLLRLLPADLLPGDELKIIGEWQRVLTAPEARGKFHAVGMEGIDAAYVGYLDSDRQVTVRRPLTPWPDATLAAIRREERAWTNAIKYRKG